MSRLFVSIAYTNCRMKIYPILVIPALFFASCGAIKPEVPNLPQSQLSSAPQPESNIDVPVSINLSQVFNDLNSRVPDTFTGDGMVGPAQYRWAIKRQPFNMSLTGDSLYIADAAHCNGGGYLKNPLNGKWARVCACDVDVNIGIHAGFNLLNNYSLAGRAVLTQFDISACNLDVVNYNVSPLLRPRAIEAINSALAGVNQQLKQYNFRSLIQPGWAQLYQPIKIGDFGYIAVNPSAIRISHPTGSGNMLSFSAGVTAKPVFYLNDPGKMAVTGVPDVSLGVAGNGFNLNLDVHLDYEPLNKLLNSAIANQQITVGEKGYIIIHDALIYGSGNNHLLIKVKFTGKQGAVPYHGLLYFTCLPLYDVNTGNFYISDIDFDTNTINRLKEGPAVWILTSGLKKYLGNEVHFNISGQVNGIKDKLNQAINGRVSPNISLSGNVNTLSVEGILPQNDHILVRLGASGNLTVNVN